MRAYLRLDPNLRKQKRSYPDGAFRAFVETLCAAEAQPHRGRFESRAVLRALLGPRAKWITYLWEHGDLEWEDDSELYVTGWDDWQEGDVTVPERMARLRAKKARKVTPTDTASVTAPDTVPVTTPRIAVGGKRKAVGEAETEAAARNDAPPTMMGFQPPKRPIKPMASLASVLDQHNRDFDPCADCGQRRGGPAHAPGRATHPFKEGPA